MAESSDQVCLRKGDIIWFPGSFYGHLGIYIGNGRVIHRAELPGGSSTASASSFSFSGARSDKVKIREDELEDVAGDNQSVVIFNFLDKKIRPKPREKIVERARSQLSQKGYHYSEYFVTWCRYGEWINEHSFPKEGDIVLFPGSSHDHYGIYIGNGRIIHRAGPPGGSSTTPASASSASGAASDKAEVREDEMSDVAGDSRSVAVFNFMDAKKMPSPPETIVKRARSQLGQQGDNVLLPDSEHFATWCRYGDEASPKKGDIVRFKRRGYAHFGIYSGSGRVIHRSGPPGSPPPASPESTFSASGVMNDKAKIREDKLEDVAGGRKEVQIYNLLETKYTPYPPEETVRRARSQLDQQGYSVLFKNCEHFVTWCHYGEKVSKQADLAMAFVISPVYYTILKVKETSQRAKPPSPYTLF